MVDETNELIADVVTDTEAAGETETEETEAVVEYETEETGEVEEMATKNTEPSFTREQLKKSKRYKNVEDVIFVALKEERNYTLAEADEIIDKFLNTDKDGNYVEPIKEVEE